ncbi:MAG: DUF4270 domain-containing protein [Chitinophagaceae bacterium]|nr:DUF4270 domain-containing protein [Chitinophagaceae bacterium]
MKLKFLLFFIGLGTWIVFFNNSCTKITPTDIGTDLLPAVDNVHTFETYLRVYADNYLMKDSSVINYTDDHALGIIEDDPGFGKTEAEIYFGIVPGTAAQYPFENADSIIAMDSVVLSLAYTGLYGDSNSVQQFNVFEIEDPAFKDSTGYPVSHPGFATAFNELGSATVSLNTLKDEKTIVVKSDTQVVSNLLRIPLDTNLGKRFAAYDTNTVYVSSNRDSAFQRVFNGLAIKAAESSPGKAALTYYSLYNENTKLTCYFRIKRNGATDTLAVDFNVYIIPGTYNAYNANIVRRTPLHGYAALDTAIGVMDAEELYLQSSPGSYAILNIPGLDTLQNSIIHRAELEFSPIDQPGNEIYTTPDLLFIDMVDSANQRFLTVPDDFNYSFTNYTYDYTTFGGYLKNDRFFFNLTRYVQNKVTKDSKNYTLRLSAPETTLDYYIYPKESGSLITASRVAFRINARIAKGRTIVGGGSHPLQPMRLRIIYSKI